MKEIKRKEKEEGKREKKYAIALDIGGTFLKTAIIDSDGSIFQDSFRQVPIDSEGSAETILNTFTQTFATSLKIAKNSKLEIIGIGIATPGPFNYEKGVSLMKKDKFRTIYGINLKDEFRKRLKLEEDFLILFEVDSWAFLRGEVWCGAGGNEYSRLVGVTLGTGLGTTFMIDNRIIIRGQGAPPYGWIAGLPFGGGMPEDKVSRRGIIARYKELKGGEYSEDLDVKEIALQALNKKDKISLQVFREYGFHLGRVLKPYLTKFKAECLILGGQISKSFSLFEKPLKNQLKSVPTLKKITLAQNIDLSSLYGVAKLILDPWQRKEKIMFYDKFLFLAAWVKAYFSSRLS